MEKIENTKRNESSISIFETAELLKNKNQDTRNLILAIRQFLLEHSKSVPEERKRQPKTIIESRFTSAEEAFDSGMVSCGAMANMSAVMLRHLGYHVKLVHGESDRSVDHAWISVREPSKDDWVEYDLTEPQLLISSGHKIKATVDDWEEIKEQIYSDNKTLKERKRERYMEDKG